MANDQQKRSLLDQLTDSATQPTPPPPGPLAAAVSAPTGGSPVPSASGEAPPLSSAPATTSGSTANLESIASSPDTMAGRIDATKETEHNLHPHFLDKLGRIAAGAVGFSDPNSSPDALLGSRIGSLIGRTGTALAMAEGTPEQKQLAEEQNQTPLKMAQIRNEQQYRQALTQNNAAKTSIAAKTEEDKYAAGDAAMGLPPGTSRMTAQAAQQNADSNEKLREAHAKQLEAQLNGEVLVTPEAAAAAGDPSLANKSLGALEYQQRVTNPINNQLKSAGGTKTVDLGADGVWGYNPLRGRTTYLGASPSVARSDAMLKRTQIPETDDQGNTVAFLNPQTHTRTSVASIGGAGGDSGVIPPKPTSSMLTQGQMAQTIQAQVPALKQEISDLGDKIGAAGGRWNDFWVKKAGVNDPAYAGVDQDLQLYATALGKAHFGASMPEGFVKDMMRDFGMAQSPEDLQARIDHAEGWVSGYAARIGGGMPKTSSPAPKGAGIYLFPDGTHRNVTATQVANLPKGATKVQ